jgi:hypothetical protein
MRLARDWHAVKEPVECYISRYNIKKLRSTQKLEQKGFHRGESPSTLKTLSMIVSLLNCRISSNGKSSKIHYAYLARYPRGHQKLKTKMFEAWRARIKKCFSS